MRVAEHVQDLDRPADVRRVAALEAAARHLRRDAVARVVRGAEPEHRAVTDAARVHLDTEHGRVLDVVGGEQTHLGDEIAPVAGQFVEQRIPRFGERRHFALDAGGRLLGSKSGKRAGDPRVVETAQQPRDSVRPLSAAVACGGETQRRPGAVRACRPEERGRLRGHSWIPDFELDGNARPILGKSDFQLAPLADEAHGAKRTLPDVVAKVEKKRALNEETLRDFLREMLLIRRFEEKVEGQFRAGELPGFLHVAIGQEAVAVGVCQAMEEGDVFASTHRAHGHTLARGTHPNAVMAELYGKMEGCSHGYGGSMHLYDVERGNYGANAVIGGGLPHVTGAGLAFKLRDEPRVAVAFFGDGATNIGTFHESLNLAQLWKTKTVFVCENNHWAESTPGWQHSPVWDDMSKRALAYDMRSIKVDGQDVQTVFDAAHEALEFARSGEGPVFLDVETYRMHGHFIGDPQVYRTKEDREEAANNDPIVRLRERLALGDDEFDAFDAQAHEIVDAALEFAKNGTDPQPEDALKNVYA
jgi:acetoin:2,6-dichlorophenolindophenol oxidoreductase subunit alpha